MKPTSDLLPLVGRRLAPYLALLGVIVGIGLYATSRNPVFASRSNLIEILRATSTDFIAACPVALLVMAGGLDLSLGALFTVGAVIAGGLMVHGIAWPIAMILGVGGAAATGTVSGLQVVYLRVPPIIATLAVFLVATGLVDVTVKDIIAPLPDHFLAIGQTDVLGVSTLTWDAVLVGTMFWLLLERTAFGYDLRAVGGNAEAAAISGVNVRRITISVYALCGAAAGLAGILYTARISAAQPTGGGLNYALQALTSVLLGGVSLRGGVGSIGGVALGSLLVGELNNALGVARFDQIWSNVVIGAVLMIAVTFDGYRRRRLYLLKDEELSLTTPPSVVRQELPRIISGREHRAAVAAAEAVNRERKRIERNLHDGAQQQLVNLSLMLQLASEALRDSSPTVAPMLEQSREGLRLALAELRDLSHGMHPMVLTELGLVPAVESLARRSAVPVFVQADRLPRLAETVEVAAYFAVAEALTNATKHARAAAITITLHQTADAVVITVADDGVGGADETRGTGLRGLRDRVQAADGSVHIDSISGAGTTVRLSLPKAPVALSGSEHA